MATLEECRSVCVDGMGPICGSFELSTQIDGSTYCMQFSVGVAQNTGGVQSRTNCRLYDRECIV